MTPSSHLDHVRSYYEALNTGDADAVAAHFTDDAVHYYTRLGPHEERERIGQNAEMGRRDDRRPVVHRARDRAGRRGRDRVDDDLARPEVQGQRLDRGTEWFLIARRQDRRGPRLPPRRARRTPRATCSASTTPAGATRPLETGSPGLKVIRAEPRALPRPSPRSTSTCGTIRREFVPHGDRPNVEEWEEEQEFPASSSPLRRARLPRAQVPRGVRRQGGDYVHDAVWFEELARCGRGRRRRRARRPHRRSRRRRS